MSPESQTKQLSGGARRRRKSRDQVAGNCHNSGVASSLYRYLGNNSSSCCASLFPQPFTFHADPPIPRCPLNCHRHGATKSANNDYRIALQSEGSASLPIAKDAAGNGEEASSKRRYSDPGVPNDSDDAESSDDCDNQLFGILSHQVNALQESNRQLIREVSELRMEVNSLRQHQKHANAMDRDYEPGMITNFVKEIRDAARIREDALLTKVKHMVEETQFTSSHCVQRCRDSDRITKLEERMQSLLVLHVANSTSATGGSLRHRDDNTTSGSSPATMDDNSNPATTRQVCEMEREVLLLRREVQEYRARKEESDRKIQQLEKQLSQLKSTSDEEEEEEEVDEVSSWSAKRMQVGPVTDL